MQLVQLDMKQISSEAEIYDCLVGQMNFTNADEKPEWMNVIEMNERDPYEMDTEEQPEDPEFKKILETPEKTLDGLVQMLAARLADDYCLEVIRDEAADDEKKELEKRLERALEDAARTIDERDGKLYAILEDTNPWHSPLSDEPEEGLIPCEVVRSSRKTIAIQITAEGRLVLRIPRRASVQAAMRFAEEHRDWIEVHYKEAVERQRNRKTYGAEEIRNFTEKLRPVLMHRVALYAACMGVTYGKITIRNQKTRWGSCSAAGNLNFNWRLALLPEDLMNYVIVHELAHRLEMNHSARFWTQVENILPDWRERRRRLREYVI